MQGALECTRIRVGYEMHRIPAIRGQCIGDEPGAEVGPSDAQTDQRTERRSVEASDLTRAQALDQCCHAAPFEAGSLLNIRRPEPASQCRMDRSPALREVQHRACGEPMPGGTESTGFGPGSKLSQCRGIHFLTREVDMDRSGLHLQLGVSPGIGDELAEMDLPEAVSVVLQQRKAGRLGTIIHAAMMPKL